VHLQGGILVHGAAQGFRHVHVAVLVLGIAPGAHPLRQDLVGQVAFKIQLAADVVIECRRVGTLDDRIGRIVFKILTDGITVHPNGAAVQATDGAVFRTAQFLAEVHMLNPQVGLFQVLGRQPGEPHQLAHHGAPPGGGQGIPQQQCQGVFPAGELLRLAQCGMQIPLQVGGQAVMVPRRGGVGGQVDDVGQVVAVVKFQRLEVEHRRDEHDAVQVHAVPCLQVARQPGRPGGAVGFACQELGRSPALVAGGVQPDEIPHRFDILLEVVEGLGFLAHHRAAETRADRVNEDQVGHVQQGEGIFHQVEGRRGRGQPILAQPDPAGTQRAQVQPDGRRAGSAVEGKGDRAGGGVADALAGVGSEEDGSACLFALRFTGSLAALLGFLLEDQRAAGGVIGNGFTVDGHLVPGGEDAVDRFGAGFGFLFGFSFCHGESPG